MSRLGLIFTLGVASTCLIAGSIASPDPARAATTEKPSSASTPVGVEITPGQMAAAITEARDLGYVSDEVTNQDGSRVVTIDLGDDFSFDLVDPSGVNERLWAGTDSIGRYVSFNATDQNAIISGTGFVLGAGLCALSAGTFCVVVGAILTAATVAIAGSGGIRCGTKALRVYPFANHKPRCA